jgi:hypothetical protein
MSSTSRERLSVAASTASRASSWRDSREDLAAGADQGLERFVLLVLGDDGNVGAAVADLDVDVPVDVGDVQQLLEVVGGDVALFLQAAHRTGRLVRVRLRRVRPLDVHVGYALSAHFFFLFLRWGC